MNNMNLLQQIDNATIDSEFAVLESMYEVYSKAYAIVESYDGEEVPGFELFNESYIMEADTEQSEENKDEERFGKGGTRFRRVKKDGTVESLAWSAVTFIPRLIGLIIDAIKTLFKSKPVQNAERNAAALEKKLAGMSEEEKKEYLKQMNAELDENGEIYEDSEGNVVIRAIKKGASWVWDNKFMLALFAAASALFTFISIKFVKGKSKEEINKNVDEALNKANAVDNINEGNDTIDNLDAAVSGMSKNNKDNKDNKDDKKGIGVKLKSIPSNIKEWFSKAKDVENAAEDAKNAINDVRDDENVKNDKGLVAKFKKLGNLIRSIANKVKNECSKLLHIGNILQFLNDKTTNVKDFAKNTVSKVTGKFKKNNNDNTDNNNNQSGNDTEVVDAEVVDEEPDESE